MENTAKVSALRDLIMDNVRKNKIVHVSYIKKDGTPREMTLMRSKKLEATVNDYTTASNEKRKWTLTQNGMLTCEELTKDKKFQWRIVNLNTVTKISANGVTQTFN